MIEVGSNAMAEYSYTVLFEPAEDGGFVVTCPALPGLVTEGDTMEEARVMAQDAIRAYIESPRRDHLPAPSDKAPLRLPWHGMDLKPGTLRSIVEQAGLTVGEFIELL